jgi:curli biogenesis system outer membrane secretion channel CsgG
MSGGLGKYEKTPTGKAIRACLMEITDYLGCVMVDKDSCVEDYKAKETTRRENTKKSIKIE